MTIPAATPMIRFMPGVLALGAGVLMGAGAGWGVASASGTAPVGPAALATGVWVLASVFGLVVLLMLSRGEVQRLGPAVLGASGTRMLSALLFGVTAQAALAPDGKAFWFTFLGAGLGALVAETTWSVFTLQPLRNAGTPTMASPAGDTR